MAATKVKATTTAAQTAADPRPVYMELRALRVFHDEGLGDYVAGDLSARIHVVNLPTSRYRTLIKGEAFWWVLGFADAVGHGAEITALQNEELPELLSVHEAARLIPTTDRWGGAKNAHMTADGITHNITAGRLYPLYGPYRVRWLFADQVRSEAAARRAGAAQAAERQQRAEVGRLGGDKKTTPAKLAGARRALDSAALRAKEAAAEAEVERARWAATRGLFPDAVRIDDLSSDVRPDPSPDPLPIAAGQSEQRRRQRAMFIGAELGWWSDFHPEDDGSFVVTMDRLSRAVPAEGVLPWVLGVADAKGNPGAIAYRDDLG